MIGLDAVAVGRDVISKVNALADNHASSNGKSNMLPPSLRESTSTRTVITRMPSIVNTGGK